MAVKDRTGLGYRSSDEADEYLRNEYRAERGAYLERRPAYAQYGGEDPERRFWGPRRPAGYYAGADMALTGTGARLQEPLSRGGSAPEYSLRSNRPLAETWTPHSYSRSGPSDRVRYSEDRWRQDRESARGLLRATEDFYEDMTEAAGLEPHHADEQRHRGRGPRNYRRSDERILDDVNLRLTEDPYIDASEIEVAVQKQEVTLSGRVTDRFAKRHAEEIAESVSGVTHVQNNLRVRPYAGEP